jgi:hypothetical protein
MRLSANHRDRARNASQMEPAIYAPFNAVWNQKGFHVGVPGLAAPEGRRMTNLIPLRPNHLPQPANHTPDGIPGFTRRFG